MTLFSSPIPSLPALLFALVFAAATPAAAQQLVWQGAVSASGQPTQALILSPEANYVIVVSGDMYFGRWQQNGRSLINDACYEFNAKGQLDPLPVFQNSLGVPVCDGNYRGDHIYRSAPFTGNGQLLSFSIFDTDYRDNAGALSVQVYAALRQPTLPPQPPPSPPSQSNELAGSWQGCDGRVATFTLENGVYVGRYTALAELARFGFTLGEIGYRVQLQPNGTYSGEVKWRWTDGRFEWKPVVITINGNRYADTGSDSCARNMTRVRLIR